MESIKNINKVIYGDKVLIDLTADTISADRLAYGLTAHTSSGEVVTGTARMAVEDNILVVPSGFGMSLDTEGV